MRNPIRAPIGSPPAAQNKRLFYNNFTLRHIWDAPAIRKVSCYVMTSPFAIRIADLQDTASVTALLEASYTNQLKDSYSPEVLVRALPLMTRANPCLLDSGTYYVIQAGA